MDMISYLGEQAGHFRELARLEKNVNVRRQLFSLARQCEELAHTIERGPLYQGRAT